MIAILLLYVADSELEEVLVHCGPLPDSMEKESGEELLGFIGTKLDEVGVIDWRKRTCGLTSDSGSNLALTMIRRLRESFCNKIAMLPDPVTV